MLRRKRRDERPEHPFTGYKLARAVLSADGGRAGFAGLTLGADQVYGAVGEAACVWSPRHAPPRKWCGCGFYCLHDVNDARDLGCATENRSALLIEVVAAGRYIRYERGLRFSNQRIRAIRESQCECGRPGAGLADAGTGIVGWRHLTPVCGMCAGGRPAILSLKDFAALLDAPVPVRVPPAAVPAPAGAAAGESPVAVLSAEIALLHARLDEIQSRLDG
ncbi:MAG: hypothetical protein J2P25_26570 [Nocardiopsaceae bacterium]|nr:hypothetical protein [Nocardiopsaceae bacterium]